MGCSFLHCLLAGLVLFLGRKKKRTQPSLVSQWGPSIGSRELHTGPGDRSQTEGKFAAGLPKERTGWCWFWHLFPVPYQQILPFPDMLAEKLTGKLGKEEEEKKKRGKNCPRVGARYCMHVHSSPRFVASAA